MKILSTGLVLLSGAVAGILARKLYLATVSCRWKTTRATVVEVGGEERSDSDFQLRYHLQIQYNYTFDKKTYFGERYTFSKTLFTKKELDRRLYSYNPGQEIDIRVNPRKPQQSVIVAGPELSDFISLACGLYVFVILLRSLW